MTTNPHYNKIYLKRRRKWLRRKATYTEKVLWQDLRNRKMKGVKFYRQFSIGNYVYDFFCPEARLAIELDGITHTCPRVMQNDNRKNIFLKVNEINLLRFTDEELLIHYKTILMQIGNAVDRKRKTPPAPSC